MRVLKRQENIRRFRLVLPICEYIMFRFSKTDVLEIYESDRPAQCSIVDDNTTTCRLGRKRLPLLAVVISHLRL